MRALFVNKRLLGAVGGFVAPVVVLLGVYAALGIQPFGPKTLLTQDMRTQYVSFFSYLHRVLTGGADGEYTFGKALGGDTAGLTAYYLNSPLNLIVAAFPTAALPVAILIITATKTGLAGLGMNLFLNREKAGHATILFSTAYALMAYDIVYAESVMWLDAVVLLPVVVWGIQRLVASGSPVMYVASLAAAIMVNFYTGFMICVFSLLYFVTHLIFFQPEPRRIRGPLLGFGAGSLLAGGLAGVVLGPVLDSLTGSKTFSAADLALRADFRLPDLLAKLVPGGYSRDQMISGLPNIYCGVFVMVFAAVFFATTRAGTRRRIGYAVLLGLVIASFYINTLNVVWHGFSPPNWFPYRYSFVFSFLLVSIAHEGFTLAHLPLKTLALITGGGLAVGGLLLLGHYEFLSWQKFVLGAALLVATAGGFLLAVRHRSRWIWAAVACVCFFDLGANAYLTLDWKTYTYADGFAASTTAGQAVVARLTAADPGFYRVENENPYNHNDPMLLGYRGLSHYSSTASLDVTGFLGSLGLKNNGNWIQYAPGSTIAADALFGVKYLLATSPPALPDDRPYTEIWSESGTAVYANPFALPLGFMAGPAVSDVAMDQPNPFELQNDIWAGLEPSISGPLFVPVPGAAIRAPNLTVTYEGTALHYVKADPSIGAAIEFDIHPATTDPLYAYFPTIQMRPVQLWEDGRPLGAYFDTWRGGNIISLGSHPAGTMVTLKMTLTTDDVFVGAAWFYQQDMTVFRAAIQQLDAAPYRVTRFSDSFFDGQISNPGAAAPALLTIPYDPNWHATLDGQAVQTTPVLGTLTGVVIPPGTHTLTLRYVPGNLYPGAGLTVLAAALLVVWRLVARRWRRSWRAGGK